MVAAWGLDALEFLLINPLFQGRIADSKYLGGVARSVEFRHGGQTFWSRITASSPRWQFKYYPQNRDIASHTESLKGAHLHQDLGHGHNPRRRRTGTSGRLTGQGSVDCTDAKDRNAVRTLVHHVEIQPRRIDRHGYRLVPCYEVRPNRSETAA